MDITIKHIVFSILICVIRTFDLTDSSPVPSGDVNRCPSSVHRDKYLRVHGDQCYEFMLHKERYWNDALKDCRSRGGNLVRIQSPEAEHFIMNTLMDLNFDRHGLWIGLTDQSLEGHWYWTDGEPLKYSNWAHGQGGHHSLTHAIDDCAQFRYSSEGKWFDTPCHLWPQTHSYICQYDMAPLPTTPPTSTASTPVRKTSQSSSCQDSPDGNCAAFVGLNACTTDDVPLKEKMAKECPRSCNLCDHT